MKTIISGFVFFFFFVNISPAEDTRPFWTEQSAYVEGDSLYVVGVASNVKTIEEGRIKAFDHGKKELTNYLLLNNLEGSGIKLETQMTYEEKNSNGTYNIFRLMFTDLKKLTLIQNKIIKKREDQSRQPGTAININKPITEKKDKQKQFVSKDKVSDSSLESGSISIDIKTNNSYVLSTKEKKVFLYLKLDIHGVKTMRFLRLPLNISLVIDRSASMEEEDKIEYTKKAALFLIDNLTQRDFLSIVAYGNVVDIISPAAPVTGKNFLKHKVKQILPGGTTNLSGGLSEGYEQVLKRYKKNFINRVIIISDGLANVGITDESVLLSLAKSYRKYGISTSSLGVGTDFDEELMLGFAEYGGGNYYFIQNPEKVPEIFRQELKQLLTVIAQNITIEVYPNPGVEVVNTFNSGYDPEKITEGGLRFNLQDISFGEQKVILIELKLPERKAGKLDVAKVKIQYDDIAAGLGRVKKEESISVVYTNSTQLVENSEDKEVNSYVRWSCATETMHEAMKTLDAGLYNETIDILMKEYNSMIEYADSYSDPWLIEKAKIFKHCADQLAKMKEAGKLHNHDNMKNMQKELHYQKHKMMIRHHNK